jgi:hypothetical protein
MTILTSFILVIAIFAVALTVAYNMQRGTKTMQEFKEDYHNNEEIQEIVDLAQELYNKDLRPIAPNKKVTTPEVVELSQTVEAVLEPAKPKKKENTILKNQKLVFNK